MKTIFRMTIAVLLISGTGCQPTTSPSTQKKSMATTTGLNAPLAEFGSDYAQAELLCKQTGRPMLLFFTAEWCKYCHQMADETLSRPEVEELTRSFICVRIDADQQPDVCKSLGIRSFPTLLCIGSQGQLLGRIIGKQPTSQVVATLQSALNVPLQARTPSPERR